MTIDSLQKNKRIAKNTIALYIRTILTMAVGLVTSRVVLNVLGVDNFGIYNVVGGIVSMFSIVTASLSQSISRYFTFELGQGNKENLRMIFCTSINLLIFMSVIIILLGETIGIWFLNNKMNIPADRMYAANWVFQFSILAFVINLINVPYNAAIIAHEKMKAFAYVSVFEAVLKLLIIYVLYISVLDKLITYSVLMLAVSLIIRTAYLWYCKRNFVECNYSFIFDRSLFRSMSKFAGWNFLASTIYIFNTQGVNIMSNMFFGVAINAARGIASQVDGITRNFVMNFTTAIRPQIIKSYSSGDIQYMHKLVCYGAKYSYYMMLLFALPLMFETKTILVYWIKIVPDHCVNFIRLTIIVSLIWLIGDTMYTSIMAVGKLKKYMTYETAITCMVFPGTYLLFFLYASPESAYIINAVSYLILIIIRLWYLKSIENFQIIVFLKQVLLPVLLTTIMACLPPIAYKMFFYDGSVLDSIYILIICVCSTIMSEIFIGLNKDEQKFLFRQYIKK